MLFDDLVHLFLCFHHHHDDDDAFLDLFFLPDHDVSIPLFLFHGVFLVFPRLFLVSPHLFLLFLSLLPLSPPLFSSFSPLEPDKRHLLVARRSVGSTDLLDLGLRKRARHG